MTLFEALRMIFSYVKATPVMISFTELGFISVSLDFADTAEVNKFGDFTEAHDPRSYRTRLVSSVSNFIAGDEEEGAITEPSNGFLTPRSPDGFEIAADNAIFLTSRPIYRIENFEIIRYLMIEGFVAGGSSNPFVVTVPEELIPQHFFNFDINFRDFIYEESVYNTLDNNSSYGDRGGSLWYRQGANNIQGLSSNSPEKYS